MREFYTLGKKGRLKLRANMVLARRNRNGEPRIAVISSHPGTVNGVLRCRVPKPRSSNPGSVVVDEIDQRLSSLGRHGTMLAAIQHDFVVLILRSAG